MTIKHKIAAAFRAVALRLEHATESGKSDAGLDDGDEVDSTVQNNPPSLLDAARALLEARENQMVTRIEWDHLKAAVFAAEE